MNTNYLGLGFSDKCGFLVVNDGILLVVLLLLLFLDAVTVCDCFPLLLLVDIIFLRRAVLVLELDAETEDRLPPALPVPVTLFLPPPLDSCFIAFPSSFSFLTGFFVVCFFKLIGESFFLRSIDLRVAVDNRPFIPTSCNYNKHTCTLHTCTYMYMYHYGYNGGMSNDIRVYDYECSQLQVFSIAFLSEGFSSEQCMPFYL